MEWPYKSEAHSKLQAEKRAYLAPRWGVNRVNTMTRPPAIFLRSYIFWFTNQRSHGLWSHIIFSKYFLCGVKWVKYLGVSIIFSRMGIIFSHMGIIVSVAHYFLSDGHYSSWYQFLALNNEKSYNFYQVWFLCYYYYYIVLLSSNIILSNVFHDVTRKQ